MYIQLRVLVAFVLDCLSNSNFKKMVGNLNDEVMLLLSYSNYHLNY
jgi:hypothetical protein